MPDRTPPNEGAGGPADFLRRLEREEARRDRRRRKVKGKRARWLRKKLRATAVAEGKCAPPPAPGHSRPPKRGRGERSPHRPPPARASRR